MGWEWPFVTRTTFEKVRRENVFLKDALREANIEIRKHRSLLAGLKASADNTTRDFEKAIAR